VSKRSFRAWLATQQYREDRYGELASEVMGDACMGAAETPEEILRHLRRAHMGGATVGTGLGYFYRAVADWSWFEH
jgi:hypothetical protein